MNTTTRYSFTKTEATALLAADGLDWTSPAVDVFDTLEAAGWSSYYANQAMAWLR